MSTTEEDHAHAGGDTSNASGETNLPLGPYDGHWWGEDSDWPKYPFEYNRNNDQFHVSYDFMRLLYGSDDRVKQDLLFSQLEVLQRYEIGDPEVLPRKKGRPTDALEVTRIGLPRWYPTELGYRAMAAWRGILTLAMDQTIPDPVVHYLNTQTFDRPAAAAAQYPKSVRDLIISNSNKVNFHSKSWIGENVVIGTKAHVNAFPNIKVGLDNRVKTRQGGGCGPFSIEAAFILGTQIAGINFGHVARNINNSGRIEGWWIGVLIPGKSGDTPTLFKEHCDEARVYGKYLRSEGNGQHDVDAGIYIAFDLDPTLEPDDNHHNVFVFIVHAIDAYSVIEVAKDSDLRDVKITPSNPPTVMGGTIATEEPSEESFTGTSTNANNTRQVAHAHVGILKRKDFMTWLFKTKRDPKELFPVYTQISSLHLYILTEDWDLAPQEQLRDWPRKNWLSSMPHK